MKKLVRLAVVVVILLAGVAAYQSPYYALYNVDKGLKERDVVRVETYVDLEEVVKSTAALFGALAAEEVGGANKDLGSRVLGAIIGGVAQGVGEAAALQGAVELRKAIQDGRVDRAFGPFVVDTGVSAFGGIEVHDRTALVTLNGSCGKNIDAQLRTVWNVRDGATFGYPKRWVLVGVDTESAKQLSKNCPRA
jgi:hypothetical protein